MSRVIVAGLDTETTGLEQEKGHRFVEIAIVLRELATGAPIGKYVQRINPQRPIDPGAQAVHGISADELYGMPTWEEVGPKVSTLLAKCHYTVIHNAGFDAPFLLREFLRIGTALPQLRIVDTMLGARWATPDGSVPNLGTLCWACDVPYDKSQAHAAEYDVECMLACFFKQYPRGFFTLPTEIYELPKVAA